MLGGGSLLKKRAMMIATTASMIEQFNKSNISILQSLGYEVHVACNFRAGNNIPDDAVEAFRDYLLTNKVKIFDLPITRAPFAYGINLRNSLKVSKLIGKYQYEIIHCHTPMGSVVARLAALLARNWHGRLIYTAHGFHFYNGAPKKNNLVYKSIERVLAHATDSLVTINKEDYHSANKFTLRKNGQVYYIPGVGIDLTRYADKLSVYDKKRNELGIHDSAILILSVGELNLNKNHAVIIKALSKCDFDNYVYVIAGQGNGKNRLEELAKQYGIEDKVKCIGYCSDIDDLFMAADIFVHPSFREGLSVAMLQAMAAGLPILASRIRGNVDCLDEGEGGYLYAPTDVEGFEAGLCELASSKQCREKMGAYNKKAARKYSIENINKLMRQVYIGK